MIRVEHNTETGEITEIEMTAAEIKNKSADGIDRAAQKAEAETISSARVAILARLGLTEEEAQLIIGGSN